MYPFTPFNRLHHLTVYTIYAGATNHVLTSLVSSFGTDPSAMLACLVPLPLKSNLQHYGLVYLQAAVKVTERTHLHAYTTSHCSKSITSHETPSKPR